MDLTVSQFLGDALEFAAVAALAFVVIGLVVSYMRFQAMTLSAGAPLAADGAAPPSFMALLAERLARRREPDQRFALLLIAPRSAASGGENFQALETQIRSAVRAEDRVAFAEAGVLAVLLEAKPSAVPAIEARILGALGDRNRSVQFGHAIADERISGPELFDRARERLRSGASPGAPVGETSGAHHDGGEASENSDLLDPLTGVLKQERVAGSLQKYVALHRRQDRPIAILRVEVDYLKRYNAQYGRDTGDRVLKRLSEFLQRNTREGDLIGRSGDDEFAVAMSATTAQAFAAARRMVLLAKKTEGLSIGSGLRFTVSIGVAGYPEHGSTSAALMEAAGQAVSQIKARGRNNCALPDKPSAAPESKARREKKEMF